MDRRLVFAIALAGLIGVGCGSGQEETQVESPATGAVQRDPNVPAGERRAVAQLESKSGSNVTGTATFVDRDGQVTLTLEVRGATPGEKGVHLHEHGDCSAPDASSAGDHWNPTNEDHGKLGETSAAHAGDIGNLTVGEDGTGRLEFTTDRWSIGRDPQTDILGRAIVVHANRDDLRSQPSGDSGARIGCGVISES